MRFSRHLTSHLTPEWRKQYIQYTELKELVYDMVGYKKRLLRGRPHNREETSPEHITVNKTLQEEFFQKIFLQLESINRFFRMEESRLIFGFTEIQEQIDRLPSLPARKASNQRKAMKQALSEFYLNVVLLQNFQQLNHTGFRKILKKYDKLAHNSRGKKVFKERVCSAYFWVSKELTSMIGEAERVMIHSLEDGDRSKAMNTLRVPPLGKRDKRSQWATYRAGFFMGLIVLSIVIIAVGFWQWPDWSLCFGEVAPVFNAFRGGFFITLWFVGFALNTYGWRRSGVNQVLIFDFDPRNYLNFIQMFEVAALFGIIWIIGLYLTAFSPWLHIPVYVGPLVMYGGWVLCLCLPLPILYHRSRLWLLKRLGRIFCAPFFPVTFADFWIADQLTSLGLALLDTESFFCYVFYGIRAQEGSPISCGSGSYALRVILVALPAWWRFAQCLRRYYDTHDANPHLINAGKYSTAFFVIIFSSLANGFKDDRVSFLDQTKPYLVLFGLWMLSAIVSTSYTFSWDVLMDWSLFPNIPRCCRKNPFQLRNDIIYQHKLYYALALIENFLFRLLWTINISVGGHVLGIVRDEILGTTGGSLEILRRIIWNFFRVENEHVNNVGQFRAVRDISIYPLDLSGLEKAEEESETSGGNRSTQIRRHLSHRASDVLQEVMLSKTIVNTRKQAKEAENQRASEHSQSAPQMRAELTKNTSMGGLSQADNTAEHSTLRQERPPSEQEPVAPGSDGEIAVEVETQMEALGSEVEGELQLSSSNNIFKVTEL